MESEEFDINNYSFEFGNNYEDGEDDDVLNKVNLEEYVEVNAVKKLHGENHSGQEEKVSYIHICKFFYLHALLLDFKFRKG